MRPRGPGQSWGAEFTNRCHIGFGWGFLPRFHDLKYRSDESDQCVILKQKAGKTLVNNNALCYFVLQSERPGAMLTVGVVCSLFFIVEWLVG